MSSNAEKEGSAMRGLIRKVTRFSLLISASLLITGLACAQQENTTTLVSHDAFPPGWVNREEPMGFNVDTLYEHINGAADQFIDYGFRHLAVTTCGVPDSVTQTIIVEVYDMETRENAFGIYSTVRSPKDEFVEIGQEGIVSDYSLDFLQSRYYVKMNAMAPGLKSVLLEAGGKIAARIGSTSGHGPHILSHIPEKGNDFIRKPKTLTLVAKDLFGLSFLDWGYTAVYRLGEKGEKQTTLFILNKKQEEAAKALFAKHQSHLSTKGISLEKTDLGNESFVAAPEDELPIWVVRRGQFIFGVHGIPIRKDCETLLRMTDMKCGKDR